MPEHTQPPQGFEDHAERSYFPAVGLSEDEEVALPRDGILLIDDSDDDAELSLRALRRLGLTLPVGWLKDSVRAINALEHARREELPRLVLLDLHMPRIDGFEVLRRLKGNARTENLCVIVMVGSARAPELARCMALNANAYVVKPLNRDSLLAACERAVMDLS